MPKQYWFYGVEGSRVYRFRTAKERDEWLRKSDGRILAAHCDNDVRRALYNKQVHTVDQLQ